MHPTPQFDLGNVVIEPISIFTGTIVAYCVYLSGNITYAVQASGLQYDGRPRACIWFDEGAIALKVEV